MTVARGLLEHARATPGALAVVGGGERRTYRELADASLATAAALLRSIGRPGARVGILAPPGPALLEAFLGAGLAGMAGVVLQTGWSDRELRAALEAAAPAVVVAPGAPARRLDPGVWRSLPPTAVGTDTPPGALPAVGDEEPFYVGFTSGTTGRPKGFVRSHRSWLRSIEASAPVLGIAAGEHLLAPGPLEHSLFLYAAVHGLSAGATVHLQPRFAPHAALRTLARLPVSRLVVVPAMLGALLRAAGERTRLPGVRAVISSGARWPAGLHERAARVFCEAEIVDFYGASELSFVSYRRPSPPDPPGLAGRPFPGVELSVRDPRGVEVPAGATGRLWVRSDLLFSGYLDPAAAGIARDAHGWASVGDLAHLDGSGRLHLAGREGTVLNCGGLTVHAEEIEEVLLGCPGVAEVAVVGVPDAAMGQLPCALVRLEGGGEAAGEAARRLRAHSRSQLARGKRPRRWLRVEDFPRTPAGKIAHAALARSLGDGTLVVEELA